MMRTRSMTLILSAMLCSAIGGCGKADDRPIASNGAANALDATPRPEQAETRGSPANASTPSPTPQTAAWIGRWTGPEGLFLDIRHAPDGKPDHYALTNKDTLDRQGDYSGVADGMTIRFVRDGKDMTIRAGNGTETGFKYLAGKTDCLIIISGQEGYCR